MPDTQWGRPAGCYTGCRDECNQGRLPCPHSADDVAAMREMGVDLRPLPANLLAQHRESWHRLYAETDPLPLTLRTLGAALLIVGLVLVACLFQPLGVALPL